MWKELRYEHRRRKLLRRAPTGPLLEHLAASPPRLGQPWTSAEFVALAVRAGEPGAGPRDIGAVTVRAGEADLSSAIYAELAPADIDAHTGARPVPPVPEAVLTLVLRGLNGRFLAVHDAATVLPLLDHACAALFGAGFLAWIADTRELARQWLDSQGKAPGSAELELDALRDRFGLSRYTDPDALTVALTTAELLVDQASRRSAGRPVKVRSLVR